MFSFQYIFFFSSYLYLLLYLISSDYYLYYIYHQVIDENVELCPVQNAVEHDGEQTE